MVKNLNGLDASMDSCTVAIQSSTGTFEEHIVGKQQTQSVLPVLQELLSMAQIDWSQCHAIVLGVGPGRFTGSRVVAGIAQGLAVARALPIVTVSSLHLLALTAQRRWPNAQRILVANNAFMGEIYCADFAVRQDGVCMLGHEQIVRPEELSKNVDKSCVVVGDAWAVYSDQLASVACDAQVVDKQLRPAIASSFAYAERQIASGNTVTFTTLKLAYLRQSKAWHKS